MKKIPKKPLDDCIEACRAYWSFGNRNLLDQMHEKSETLGKAIGVGDFTVCDFISTIVKAWGLCPDAENDEIYCALRVLGWDIIDEQKGR